MLDATFMSDAFHVLAMRGKLLAVLLLIGFSMACGMCKSDPATGKVRVMFVGEVSSYNRMVLDWLMAEPRIQLTRTVPCDIQIVGYKDAVRFARIYLPRSYKGLFEDNDVAIFHDFHPKVLPRGSIDWFGRAVENGFGLCLIEFAYRVAGYAGMDVWPTLQIYKLFPGEFVINQIEAIYGRQYYRVVKEGPLLGLPGIEKYRMNWGWHGDLKPRPGTVVWAVWKGRGTPAIVTGTYGQGKVLQMDSGYDTLPQETKRAWPYVADFVYNHVTFVSGLPFPDDIELTHTTRRKFIRYRDEKAMANMVLEFIEKFGANPRPFEVEMADMASEYSKAERLYIDGDVEEANAAIDDLLDRFVSLSNEMTKAKDRAMLWIYVSEWLAVSGTSMVCGFVLWSLMVRKRLYREVEITRASGVVKKEWGK